MKTKFILLIMGIKLSGIGAAASINEFQLSLIERVVGKEWKIISVITSPPFIDVNGDGIPDSEIVESLQPAELEKSIIFNKDGSVTEKEVSDNGTVKITVQGTWRQNNDKNSITWERPDNVVLFCTYENEKLKLSYHDENIEIKYTMTLKHL
jgi:hypothetical protein